MNEFENRSLLELYQLSMNGNNRDATKALQKRVGSPQDGIYGPNTEAAYAAKTAHYAPTAAITSPSQMDAYAGYDLTNSDAVSNLQDEIINAPTPEQQSAIAAGGAAAASSSSAWIPAAIAAGGSVLSSITGRRDPTFGPVRGNASLGELKSMFDEASNVSHKAPSKRGGFYR
ncbi:hypothetical protein [Vibrio vulnificus]|uniref:hypothetical protein n=1 Tax=Vibrio vulnificus TaxID=672 RepID=UPI001594D058|nr:hypothetical protein [Vibrio vulnificus]NVC72609.1 hypothetical protein [Vibrio vulnificus]